MIMLYGIRNCDACRNASKWLTQHGVQHQYVDIREDGLSEALLGHWQESVGSEALLNRRSITWRKIPESDRDDLSDTGTRELILNYPTAMKRPILDLGTRVVLGFDESVYDELDL